MTSRQETQFESAKRMYTPRAANYEDSWHPEYSDRFMALVDIKPGSRVLSLACGTGLDAGIAAERVGDEGIVIGVDATEAMLDEARKKQNANPILKRRLKLVLHDVTHLNDCPGVEKESFDMIICSSAFVLFEDPAGVVEHWRDYLKPGGRMAIDITHEKNLRSGLLMEKVARRLGIPFPSNRFWIKSRDSFREILEKQGMIVERIELVEKQAGIQSTFMDISQSDEQFDYILRMPLTALIDTEEFRAKARPLFQEEWNAAAVDGKVEVSETVYVYIARKD
ncbi:S-adenosyl-L-methionine-dependent methyltransferase [Mariannaea sp. PMI_226]|nr:S-adenosyl-L-methionine-dependent methyltransferase [Mariannaea sp. PMI_226]